MKFRTGQREMSPPGLSLSCRSLQVSHTSSFCHSLPPLTRHPYSELTYFPSQFLSTRFCSRNSASGLLLLPCLIQPHTNQEKKTRGHWARFGYKLYHWPQGLQSLIRQLSCCLCSVLTSNLPQTKQLNHSLEFHLPLGLHITLQVAQDYTPSSNLHRSLYISCFFPLSQCNQNLR